MSVEVVDLNSTDALVQVHDDGVFVGEIGRKDDDVYTLWMSQIDAHGDETYCQPQELTRAGMEALRDGIVQALATL